MYTIFLKFKAEDREINVRSLTEANEMIKEFFNYHGLIYCKIVDQNMETLLEARDGVYR